MAIEIVDFPIKTSGFPVRYVSLPEGIYFGLAMLYFLWKLSMFGERSSHLVAAQVL